MTCEIARGCSLIRAVRGRFRRRETDRTGRLLRRRISLTRFALRVFLFQLGLAFPAGAVPPVPPVPTITLLPDMPKGGGVTARDDGLSVKIGTNCCFLFGDTVLTRPNSVGDTWVVNTMYHTTDTN